MIIYNSNEINGERKKRKKREREKERVESNIYIY
jgi:hypothetical protein